MLRPLHLGSPSHSKPTNVHCPIMKIAQTILLVGVTLACGHLMASDGRPEKIKAFEHNIATSKIGKMVECTGKWDLRDKPEITPMACASLGLPTDDDGNYVNTDQLVHNGWTVVDRQTFPYVSPEGISSPNWLRVVVRLKKTEARKQYEEPKYASKTKP